jgi:myo-inositol-1(or 4)-monophosphatase
VACGRLEGFWEEHLHAWDVAAGVLIVEEAGGRCTRFDDERSAIFDTQIVASNGHIHKEVLRVIRKAWTDWSGA